MKKAFSLLLVIAMLLSVSALTVSAAEYDYINQADYYEHEAAKIDEIYDSEAGIASTKWTVPYLPVTPELDGKINVGEYERFENYEDYLTYSMRTNNGQNSVDEFYAFLDAAKPGFFDAYWGWDGQYLYMAFNMDCFDGYFCDPSVHGASYLYACTAVQFGLGQADAEYGQFSETGFGINPDGNTGVTTKWLGNYIPDDTKDVAGEYNETTKRLTIEFRINLQLALDMDETVQNGDQARMCWLLSVGGDGDNLRCKQVSFCHGIGGSQSNKAAQYFATITFDGLPDGVEVPIEDRVEISELDKEYDLRDFVVLSQDDAIDTFSGNNATVEKVTEGGESFMRITATGDQAYVYGNKYPVSVSSETKFVVIKYRTTSTKASEMGIIYKSTSLKEYDLDATAFETVTADGQWHYLYIEMSGEEHWQDWIVSLGIVPFVNTTGIAGESVDIAWIKFYRDDPWDIPEYEADREATETTEEPTTEEITTEPATTEAQTEAPSEEVTEAEESGCKGIVSGAFAVVALIGVAFVVKKKD
ncbi:MAG: hypothetical protein IKB28_03320 [Clostridia bacterium]|nr:hypothetical protein [Clostridia bacterium]